MYKVYIVTNLLNKKRYIGITSSSIKDRFNHHCSQGYYLTSSIKKHGRENFIIEQVATCSSKKIAATFEVKLIAKLQTKAPYGYNFTNGGECPTKTKEVSEKISKSKRGKKFSESHKKAVGDAARIRSAKLKGTSRPAFSQQWKDNMSKGKKGIKLTQEHKDNISKALKARKLNNIEYNMR